MLINDEEKMDLSEEIIHHVLNDLQGRQGIGDQIDNIEDDIRVEMELELKQLISKVIEDYAKRT